MTDEQRDIIAESKKEDASLNIDKKKLQEAEQLAAAIEAESYSKSDLNFEKRHNHRNDDNLTDDQLVDLFSEMKRETQAKREKEMQRFKIEKPENNKDDALLDDFDDELAAMRGADSDNEEVSGLIQAAGNQYAKVGDASGLVGNANAFQFGALEDDEALEDEEAEEVLQEPVKYFNDSIKEKLAVYRENKRMERLQNQKMSVESNLERLFQNFQVVTQQRHKVKLHEINEFQSEPISNGEEFSAKQSLISSIFSQINPFAQYVIQDIFQETEAAEADEAPEGASQAQDAHWTLHESLFKRNAQHQVNPDNLKKTSSQMFSVYKYYENPSL